MAVTIQRRCEMNTRIKRPITLGSSVEVPSSNDFPVARAARKFSGVVASAPVFPKGTIGLQTTSCEAGMRGVNSCVDYSNDHVLSGACRATRTRPDPLWQSKVIWGVDGGFVDLVALLNADNFGMLGETQSLGEHNKQNTAIKTGGYREKSVMKLFVQNMKLNVEVLRCAHLASGEWKSDSIDKMCVAVQFFTVSISKKFAENRILLLDQVFIVLFDKI